MAAKITRQPNKIALLGAPTSAASLSAGHEHAPAKLREAGLVDRLRAVGYDVTDMGDDHPQLYQSDEESPRSRNLPRVLKALEALKPRVEQAVKSGALPLVLGGDCTIALATIAALRRYFRSVSAVYMDRDADLNTPATTPSGLLDGMVVAHLTGRGAAELVRFWGEPPLVREPDVALFGVVRLDHPEEDLLLRSPIQRYLADNVQRLGPAAAAQMAIERIHAAGNEFLLHFDVDVIADFRATNFPGSGGLTLDEVRQALEVFAQQKHMAAFEVTAYNPERDPDGSAAKTVVDIVVSALATRLERLAAAAGAPASAQAPPPVEPVLGQATLPAGSETGPAPASVETSAGQAGLADMAAVPVAREEPEAMPSPPQPPAEPGPDDAAKASVAPAAEPMPAPPEGPESNGADGN